MKTKLSVLLLAIMTAFPFSCDNSPELSTLKTNKMLLDNLETMSVEALNSNAPAKTENPSNPYDFVGFHHNASLEVIRVNLPDIIDNTKTLLVNVEGNKSARKTSLNTRIDKTIGLIQNYWSENVSREAYPGNLFENVKSSYLSLTKSKNPNVRTSSNSDYEQLFYSKLIELESNNGISSIETSIDSLFIGKLDECEDLNDLLNLATTFESVISSSNLSIAVKERQLTYFSIFRYSSDYWENVSKDPSSEWHLVYQNIFSNNANGKVQLPKWLKWAIIGAADAVGGLAGGLVSSPVGGVIVGGIVGGVASGLAEDLLE